MIGAALGYPVELCLPSNASRERKRILSAYGAKIVLTPADDGSDGAIRRAREIYASALRTNFSIPISTAIRQTGRRTTTPPRRKSGSRPKASITHFVAGLGTSGTFVGTAQTAQGIESGAFNASVCSPTRLFTDSRAGSTWRRRSSRRSTIARWPMRDLVIRTEDAYRMVKRLAREEAMLVSPSAAAALVGCLQVASSLGRGERAVIVTIFPDAAEKYLSERFWDEN